MPAAKGRRGVELPMLAGGELGLVLLAAALFLLLSYFPLRPTDLWVHVNWGDWILDYRALPAEDPFVPLAGGMEVIDTAWLSQLLLALLARAGGGELLSFAFALVVLAAGVLLVRAFRWTVPDDGGGSGAILAAALLAVALFWSRLSTLRPESFAVLCCAALLWWMSRWEASDEASGWQLWLGTGVLGAAWANLHGSFPVGWAIVGLWWAGRAADVAIAERRWFAPFEDRRSRQRLVAVEVMAAASLLNPYGLDLPLAALGFGAHPNLVEILEWLPWRIDGVGGPEIVLLAVVVVTVARLSPRRLSIADALLLAFYTLAALWRIRMLTWLAPVAAWVLAPHLAAIVDRHRRRPPRRRPAFTVAAALAVVLALVFSPASALLTGSPLRTAEQLLGPETPLAAARALQALAPVPLTFTPHWWGDYLARVGLVVPFAGSNLHLLPQLPWADHQRVARGVSGWTEVLDRYAIDRVVLDLRTQAAQAATLRADDAWRLVHEDPLAAIFERVAIAAADRAEEGTA